MARVENVHKPKWEQGNLLKWLHKSQHVAWGTDPGEYDPDEVKRTLPTVKKLFGPGRYFGVDVKGWENMPEAPVMIVSNHSGGRPSPTSGVSSRRGTRTTACTGRCTRWRTRSSCRRA